MRVAYGGGCDQEVRLPVKTRLSDSKDTEAGMAREREKAVREVAVGVVVTFFFFFWLEGEAKVSTRWREMRRVSGRWI